MELHKGKRNMFLGKISIKRIIVFILSLVLVIEAFLQCGQEFLVEAKEQSGVEYTLYVDTSMVGVDAELLKKGIGAYLYDVNGNASTESPIAMEKVEGRDHIYKFGLDEQYPYVAFTEGTCSNAAEQTSRISIDWGIGAPCFKLSSENLTDGGTFYGLYTVYFDVNDTAGAENFTENGVGVYAYNSETESYSSMPVAMKESDKGEGIYEYSFDQPYQYIAFMNGYDSWDYDVATSPVYIQWGYESPCFLLESVNGESSAGLWWNLSSVVYFDASEIKDDEVFVENGVYLYAYNEIDGRKEEFNANPVKMPASGKGEDFYEFTLDKPYENVQFILGDSFDAEVQSDIIDIDWMSYEEPCYKMTVERTDIPSEESQDIGEAESEVIEVPPESTGEMSDNIDGDALQPIDEACVTADGLSAISVFYTMEWLGSQNDLLIDTVSSEDENSSDDGTAEDDATDENTVENVQVDGELTDIGGNATTDTVAAPVMFSMTRSTTASTRTIYFDACRNNGYNGWTTDVSQMYIHAAGVTNELVEMTKSTRLCPDGNESLWEYTVPLDCTLIIFSVKSTWTTSGTDYSAQTVDVVFSNYGITDSDLYVCFGMGDGFGTNGKKNVAYIKDLGPLSKSGNPIYFYDMTSSLSGTVTAEFTNSSGTSKTVTPDSNGAYIIPADESVNGVEVPYTTVTFYNASGEAISSAYNFFNDPATGEVGFLYDEITLNAFYYGVTEKTTEDPISKWGVKTQEKSLAGNTLYFDATNFPPATGGRFQIGSGTLIDLTNTDGRLSYTFEDTSTATQDTVLTFIAADGTEYHFLWSDFNANVVTMDSSIAEVTDAYYAGTYVYFDATYSKLSYASDCVVTGKYESSGIPADGGSGTIRYFATKSTDSSVYQEGNMVKVSSYVDEAGNTWEDVYKTDQELPAGYDRIVFSNFDMSSATNYGGYGNSTTTLSIPVMKNPCFYADGGDSSVYSSATGGRSGYWDEVYSIRDAEKGKNTETVDIKTSTFTRDPKTLYINSTFYDYYSDYELDGNNRDDYPDKTTGDGFASQRSWVTFRQFDQALSDYYKKSSASIPIYTGHFQPTVGTWGLLFGDVADTLNLYGYNSDTSTDDYKEFFSTNNSVIDVNGKLKDEAAYVGFYEYASQGLVSGEMSDDSLMIETSGGTIKSPHFDKDFLTGSNSKNAVIGKVYDNVVFPFTSEDRDGNGVNYWTFDSAETTLAMRYDSSAGYYLQDVGNQDWSKNLNSGSQNEVNGESMVSNTYGFLPFNETSTATTAGTYNYGFGTKLEFQFRLTEDGTVQGKDTSGNTINVPISFTFSGDDDVWVFIDDQLVLDVGGSHAAVTASIEFTDHDTTAEGRQIKSTVSAVKASAGSATSGTDVANEYTLTETTKTEHTLTMYYMERGMWESNMSISFNFPDENQLEVEKQVDETEVNELFQGLFEGVSLFEYTIKNQATHYGSVDTADANTLSKVVFNDSFNGTVENVGSNTFSYVSSKADKTDVVHWFANLSDASGSYRDKRYGTIYANNISDGDINGDGIEDDGIIKETDTYGNKIDYVDISKMSYLEFKYYYDYTDTPSLTYMYLQLIDTEGNIKGNISDYLSNKSYGIVDNASKEWVTVKIDLSALQEETGFNDKVVAIKFGYNYPRNFYLDDFIFRLVGQAEETTGFVKKQYTIPDYGSAESGQLEVAENAFYTSTETESGRVVDEDGHFYLQDGETVIFKDQFRRGSYIYLEETSNPLFDTSWTMYENGEPVTAIPASIDTDVVSTSADVTNLVNVQTTKVEDGRTEKVITGTDEDGKTVNPSENKYNGTKPSDNTIVFRSYSYPNDVSITTKLRVTYTNKINIGSLKIEKKKKYDNEELGSYTFKITFSNVGGIALESAPIETTVTVKAGESVTIDGIPIGTSFTLEEVTPEDGSYLDSVEVNEPLGEQTMVVEEGNIVRGVVVEKTDDESSISVVTVTNTMEPKISASLTKKWVDEASQEELTNNIPASVTVQLQRKLEGADDSTYTAVEGYEKITIEPKAGEDGNAVWTYTATGLDKLYDYPNVDNDSSNDNYEWVYRFVEIKVTNDDTGEQIHILENGQIITLTNTSSIEGDYEVTYKDANNADADQSTDPMPDVNGAYSTEITNTLLYVDLKVNKLVATDTGPSGLEGVTFQLEKAQEDEDGNLVYDADNNIVYEETKRELTTDSSGGVNFDNLENGTYRLTELKTAAGYTLLKEPLIIEIDRVQELYRYRNESETDESAYKSLTLTLDDTTTQDAYAITLEIYNALNIVLPATGWTSPVSLETVIILLGICLTVCFMYRSMISKSRREGKPPE